MARRRSWFTVDEWMHAHHMWELESAKYSLKSAETLISKLEDEIKEADGAPWMARSVQDLLKSDIRFLKERVSMAQAAEKGTDIVSKTGQRITINNTKLNQKDMEYMSCADVILERLPKKYKKRFRCAASDSGFSIKRMKKQKEKQIYLLAGRKQVLKGRRHSQKCKSTSNLAAKLKSYVLSPKDTHETYESAKKQKPYDAPSQKETKSKRNRILVLNLSSDDDENDSSSNLKSDSVSDASVSLDISKQTISNKSQRVSMSELDESEGDIDQNFSDTNNHSEKHPQPALQSEKSNDSADIRIQHCAPGHEGISERTDALDELCDPGKQEPLQDIANKKTPSVEQAVVQSSRQVQTSVRIDLSENGYLDEDEYSSSGEGDFLRNFCASQDYEMMPVEESCTTSGEDDDNELCFAMNR